MLAIRLLSAGLFLVPVLADGAAIVSALRTVAVNTALLNNTVLSWNGDILGSPPILARSSDLLHSIDRATEVTDASANLTLLEAISVATATQGLIKDVNMTLSTIIAAKPKFDRLDLDKVTLVDLKFQRGATATFSVAVARKVPSNVVSSAAALSSQIDESFAKAIAVYQR